ncbi:MAG: hypothetical protein ACFFD2_06450 [Promethearchaeota archaeon]
MELTRNIKILILIIIIVSVTIPLVVWLTIKSQQQSPIEWTITLYVDETEQVNVTYQEITDTSLFPTFTNQHFVTIKYVEQIIDKDGYYTGISLWDLITYSGINITSKNAVKFVASDGWATPSIPLSLIQNSGSLAAIVYDQQGGWFDLVEYGPLLPMINASIYNPKVSSRLSPKNFTKIVFETYNNWNLTLGGDFQEGNATFALSEIMTASVKFSDRVENMLFNYTDINGITELRNLTGIGVNPLFDRNTIINETAMTANAIRFVAEGGHKSNTISWADVKNNDREIAIIWAENGELLDETNGYLMAVVDFNINPTTNSSYYWTEKVVGIEFLTL